MSKIYHMETHIVFDLDWTLADTQKIHQQIESDFLTAKWADIEPQTIGVKYAWRTPQERISEALTSAHIEFTKKELEDFVSKKDEVVISLLHQGKIELMPYAFETLVYFHKKGYKIGISSWSCREFIDKFIIYFHLEDIISASTSANEVEKKKPNPDVFLSSFDQLKKKYGRPDQKYVIGDGWSDMEWWYKAWAKTIWLNYLKKTKLNDI